MKLAIADGGDCLYDSGVFLDFEGLTCPNSDAQLVAIDSISAEGCGDASFQIVADFAVPTTVNITSTGTATNGVDFTTPGSYNLPAGVSTTNITISPVADGVVEGTENANIILSYSVCGTLVYDTITITILDQPTINFNSTVETCGACNGTASATFSNAALPIASMVWTPTPGGGQGTANITGLCQGDYVLSIIDANGCPATDTVTIGTTCPTCIITALTVNQGACENPANVYDVTGSITFANAPASGTLTVTACDGTNQVFNAPFTSPQAYTLNNLPANSAACSVVAVFSADVACTQTINFTNPAPCDVPCAFTSIVDTVGLCDGLTNDFPRHGVVTFTNAPSTGLLLFTDCKGNTDTIFPPFTSPANYYLEANSDGTIGCDITAVFTSAPACTINIANDYPVACGCPADAGTTVAGVFGDGLMNYVLCYNDTIIIASNGDEVNPLDVGPLGPGITYNPGITFGIYTCPPTPNTNPELDPCYTGFITGTIGVFGDLNDGGLIAFLAGQGVTFTNNVIYFAPIILYNQDSLIYDVGCVDVGSAIAVQYLPEIISSNPTPNCQDSSFTITINGGYPALLGGNFTASNLLPATASFVNTTTTNGGTIKIHGLQDGDMYSFDVADTNGCPITISGGPFVGLPNANAGVNDTSCTLTYNLNAIPSIGTGTWTGPANVSFTPNANDPNAVATSTTAGAYTLTWTEDNTLGCTDAASVNITFTQMSIPNVLTHVSCAGGTDGQVVVAPQGGIAPYTYSWTTSTNTTPVENNLPAGNTTVTVTDAKGCSLDSTFTLTQPAAFGVSISNVTQVLCKGGSNGAATATVNDVINTYTYSWNTVPVQNTATVNNFTAGTYLVTVTQSPSGCIDTASVTIIEPDSVLITSMVANDTICTGQSTNLTATATGGSGSGYVYTWDNGLGVGQTHTVSPLSNTTTTYTVTAVDGNGCSSPPRTVTVVVHPALSVIASGTTTICPETSTTLGALASFGNGGPYMYSWTPTTNMTGANTSSPIVTPTATTTYTVTLSDGCSPSVTDQVTVSLWNLPQPDFSSDTLSLCIEPRGAITFYNLTDTTNGMLDTNRVFWDFGDGTPLISQPWDTIQHTYNQAGTYTVSMLVYSQATQGGCQNTHTEVSMISIHALPIADFSSTPNITSMFDPEIQFIDQSGSAIDYYHWDFAGLDTSNYPNPLYIFPDDTNGVYSVTLTVVDMNGCTDDITKEVIIRAEYGIYVPNAFTPDFDFKNDMFGPTGFGISPENYHFMIFDRWGEKVFDTDVLFKPWNGFYKGTRVQEGVYVWKLFFKDYNDKKHEQMGHVTIIQ
jgi:gliding motility-associated-like protein